MPEWEVAGVAASAWIGLVLAANGWVQFDLRSVMGTGFETSQLGFLRFWFGRIGGRSWCR